MPDGRPEEFDEDMATPLCDFSHASACSPDNAIFTYADQDIDLLSDELGILWVVLPELGLARLALSFA